MHPAQHHEPSAGEPCTFRVGGYRAFQPPAVLRGVAGTLWVHKPVDGNAAPFHRVLPDAGAALVLYRSRLPNGRLQDGDLYLHGPIVTPRRFALAPERELIGITLHAEALLRIVPVSAREVPDAIVPLRDLAPSLADACRRLAECAGPPEAAMLQLTRWVGSRLACMPGSAPPRLQRALALLRSRHGNVRIRDLARSAGYSQRQLRRASRDLVGIGPKQMARQLRFLALVEAADGYRQPPWADLAARFGYFDQAHLIAEARSLGHASPTVIHAERRAQD